MNLVCLDRDGTINEDNNYYLGASPNWQNQLKFLPKVIAGIKYLNSLPDTHVFITTNQSGVALTGPKFDALTEERMHEVNRHIINQLREQGANIKGYFACPFVDNAYAEKARNKRREINPKYLRDNHRDLKPNIGMLKHCAKSLNLRLNELNLYVIGDRATDVQMGLNGGGTGILIASAKTTELGDIERVQKLHKGNPGKIFIAEDFLDATKYVQA